MYDPTFFEHQLAAESRHFWFLARNRVIATIVGQIISDLEPGYRVLEVGCGAGGVLGVLEKECARGKVIGVDLFAEGLRYARQRTGCSVIQADIDNLPFGTPFDMIGLFDVLEHQQDDMRILSKLRAQLNPGGILLLTVPAHPSLWSYWDEANHHWRRYQPFELERKLREAGYQVDYLTQFMASLYPVMLLFRRLTAWFRHSWARAGARSQHVAAREFRVVPIINELMGLLLNLELPRIARRRRVPIGTSLLAVARKDS
ncbi:MAG: class I SAM-dependent methyltransferase [Acidobacteria bacterium]|nr:class I SAM-dependent methyltransferase [Acidobacteriota bacterium]